MKKEDIIKELVPGVVVGFILGIILVSLVGVNKDDVIPNFIGGAMCCGVPTLLNCLIVLKQTAKHVKRKLSILEALKYAIGYILLAFVVGFFVVAIIVHNIMGIDICKLSVFVTAIYESILGVIVSTIFAYLALKRYLKKVKYTKRK